MEIVQNLAGAIVVLLGLAAGALALTTKHRDLLVWIAFAGTIFASLAFFAWLQNHFWKNDEEKLRTTVSAGSKPFPEIPIPPGRPPHAPETAWTVYDDEMILLIGPFVVSTSSNAFTILKLYGKDILGVRIDDGLAKIDADIWDKDGRLLTTIEQNRLRVNQNNTLPVLRPDPHTFIVQNEKKENVLYFEFLNQRCIRIKGIFRSDGKYPVVVSDDEITFGPLVYTTGMALHIQGSSIFEWPGKIDNKKFLKPTQELKANEASLGIGNNNGAINIMLKMKNGDEYSIFQIGGTDVPEGTQLWPAFGFKLKEEGTY